MQLAAVNADVTTETISPAEGTTTMSKYSFRIRRYGALVGAVLSLAALAVQSIDAQTNDQGRIVHIRDSKSGVQAVSYATGQATMVYGGRCSSFSPHLDYVVQIDPQVFDQLVFVNIDTGQPTRQVSWQADWTQSCLRREWGGMGWVDNQTFIIPSEQDPQQVYYIDRDTGAVSGPFAAPPLPNTSPTPNRNPKSHILLFSPSGQQVVYERCEQPNCVGNSAYVIYDLQQQSVIAEIKGHDYLESAPRASEQFFSWSYSGRYLAHHSIDTEIAVYDLANQAYVDLSFLPARIEQLITVSVGWQWSPDSTQVAFWVGNATTLGYSLDYGLAIVDLEAQTFRLHQMTLESLPSSTDAWAWTPSGESLLVKHNDNRLFEMNLTDGSQTFVAAQVSLVLAWYPPEPTSSPATSQSP